MPCLAEALAPTPFSPNKTETRLIGSAMTSVPISKKALSLFPFPISASSNLERSLAYACLTSSGASFS
mgnify:CR=1 FL=1